MENFSAMFGTALGIWLMFLFVGIVFWAYRSDNKKRFEADGMIPFKED